MSVAVGLSAPVVRSLAWRVPFSQLSIVMVLRSVAAGALTTALFAGLALGCLSFVPADATARGLLAAGFGGTVGLTFTILSARRLRKLRGVLLLAHRVREPGGRGQALQALHRILDRERESGNPKMYAQMVLLTVAPFTHAGLWEEAESLLSGLALDELSDHQCGIRAQGLATCRLQLEDVAGAAAVIEELGGREVDELTARWLSATQALIWAVRGEAKRALDEIGEPLDETDPVLRASKQIVAAHAYVTLGKRDRARKALEEALDEVGPEGLSRVHKPKGPATKLALEVLRAS